MNALQTSRQRDLGRTKRLQINAHRPATFLMMFVLAVSLALGLASCEDNPANPNNPAPFAPCGKIIASRGTAATGGMIVHGQPGSVPAGAKVIVTDKNGKSATTTARPDGSFDLKESDLPSGFDHTIGNSLDVTAGSSKQSVTIDP
jgi:hypothetical protein